MKKNTYIVKASAVLLLWALCQKSAIGCTISYEESDVYFAIESSCVYSAPSGYNLSSTCGPGCSQHYETYNSECLDPAYPQVDTHCVPGAHVVNSTWTDYHWDCRGQGMGEEDCDSCDTGVEGEETASDTHEVRTQIDLLGC